MKAILITLGFLIVLFGMTYLTRATPEMIDACMKSTNWSADRCAWEIEK